MKQKYFSKILIIALFFGVNTSWGQLSVTTSGTDFVIDFDSTVSDVNNGQYQGNGLNPTPTAGQLDGDAWAVTGLSDGSHDFGDTSTSGDYTGSSSGGVTGGGFYAFEVAASNYAFGVQPTGSDFTTGTLTLKIDNNTGSNVIEINVGYNLWVLNNATRSNSLNFSYSTDNSSYTNVNALDYTSTAAADGTPVWMQNGRFTNISGLNIPDGGSFYIRWTGSDVGGSGSRDEFAIDDITVKMSSTVLNTENVDDKLNISVYPNPVNDGRLFLKSNNSETKNVEIYNVLGRKVLTDKVTTNQEINVSNLSAGVYVLRIKEGDKSLTKKIVIK